MTYGYMASHLAHQPSQNAYSFGKMASPSAGIQADARGEARTRAGMNNNVSAICDALERWEKALQITGLPEP